MVMKRLGISARSLARLLIGWCWPGDCGWNPLRVSNFRWHDWKRRVCGTV